MTLSRIRPAVLMLVLLAVVLLPAVASAQDQASDLSARAVTGPVWQLLKYRQEGELALVPPGVGVEVYLWAGSAVGKGACGQFASTYTLAKDLLRIDPPEVDARPCEPDAQVIDDAFYQHLANTASWSIDGSALDLSDASGEPLLSFTKAAVPIDPTIAPWRLARVTEADGGVASVVAGSAPEATFLPGGRVVGQTGCGPFLGSYGTNDTTISISDIHYRNESCTPDLRAQADLIIETLGEVTDFAVRPAGLALEDASGLTRLAWVPTIPLPRRSWTPTEILDPEGNTLLDTEQLASSSIEFEGDTVAGRSMCRAYTGTNLRSGLALTVFDITPAKAPCKPKKSEAIYLGALGEVASHALRGSQLELLDKDGNPLVRLTPQPALIGVRWVLSLIDAAPATGRSSLREPVGLEPPTATLVEDGILVGETGANPYQALYDASGSRISIRNPLAAGQECQTRKSRLRSLCRQERLFVQRLIEADAYIVLPDRLRLLRGNRVILEFLPTQTDEPAQDAEEEA